MTSPDGYTSAALHGLCHRPLRRIPTLEVWNVLAVENGTTHLEKVVPCARSATHLAARRLGGGSACCQARNEHQWRHRTAGTAPRRVPGAGNAAGRHWHRRLGNQTWSPLRDPHRRSADAPSDQSTRRPRDDDCCRLASATPDRGDRGPRPCGRLFRCSSHRQSRRSAGCRPLASPDQPAGSRGAAAGTTDGELARSGQDVERSAANRSSTGHRRRPATLSLAIAST